MADRNISVLLTANSSSLKQQLAVASREVQSFGRQVNSTSSGVASSTGVMTKAIAGGALLIGAGLAYAVSSAIGFETQMRNVNSISKMSEAQLSRLSATVLEMSTQLPQTAEDLAKGLYDVASSGFQGAEGVTILAASAKAATAGLSDTATSVRAITGVINAYGLEAKDAKYVSDVLFQTVNLGVVTFDELAASLGQTTGIAAAAKVDIAQVGAALATMTLSGLDAAESSVSLNRLIQALLQPSEALAATYKTLGIESGSQALATLGLKGVMDKLRESTGGNVDALLKLFPEIRAVRGAMALMANEGGNYARVAREIENRSRVAGSTQAAFAEQMKASGAQFAIMKNRVQAAAIEIGTHLLPVLTEAAGALMGGVGSAISYFSGLWSELAPLLEAVATLVIDLAKDLEPLAEGLATIAAVGILVPLEGLFRVLTALLGVMDRNRGVVLALGAALLLLRSNAIVAALSTSTLGTTIGVGMLNALGAIRSLVTWLSTLDLTMSGLAAGAKTVGSTMLNALTSPGVAIGILVAGLTAIAIGYRSMQAEAERYAAEQAKGFKTDNLRSQQLSIQKLTADWNRLHAEVRSTGFGDWLVAAADVITANQFISDSALDTATKQQAISPVLQQQIEDYQVLNTALQQTAFAQDTLSSALDSSGMSWSDAQTEMDRAKQTLIDFAAHEDIKMPDPHESQEVWNDWADAVAAARREAMNLTPAQVELSKALKVIGDDASTNKEKVDAFKESLDAIFGVHISAFEAATKTAAGFDALTKSLVENGTTFDLNTEKGRNNRDAFSSLTKQAIDHADAIAKETGNLDLANGALAGYVQRIHDVLIQSGLSEPAVASLMQQLGLLDSSGKPIVVTVDGDQAKEDIQNLQTLADQLDQKRNISVGLIAADADQGLEGLQVAVTDITGKQHVITVGANTKDADTEIAGFQIRTIDPLTGEPAVVTLNADTADADLDLAGFQAKVKFQDGRVITTTIDLEAADANVEMAGVQKWIHQTDGTFVLTTVDTEWDGKTVADEVDEWNRKPKSTTTTIDVKDFAKKARDEWDHWKPETKRALVDTVSSLPEVIGGLSTKQAKAVVDVAVTGDIRALEDVVNNMDLAKGTKESIIKVVGAEIAKANVDTYLSSLHLTEGSRTALVEVAGTPEATSTILAYADKLHLTEGERITLLLAEGSPAAVAEAQKLINKGNEVDGMKPVLKVNTSLSDSGGVQGFIDRIFGFSTQTHTFRVNTVMLGDKDPFTPGIQNARGNILTFANGGEAHVAQIGDGATPRTWNEPETGGEAYIPLGMQKRERSTNILADVASRFGYQLTRDGGQRTVYVGGDTLTINSPINVSGSPDRSAMADLQVMLDDRDRKLVQKVRAKRGRY